MPDTKQDLVDRLIKSGYAKPSERDDLLQYDVSDLQEALDRSAPKPPKPRRHAEYAHPFSCEGTGQWED